MTSQIVILGPQRFEPTLADAAKSLGIDGDIATVTAGWQEREAEDAELRDHLGSRTVNLLLHRRGEDVFQSDRQLQAAHGLRQERLRQLQVVYRLRLAHAKAAAREMLGTEGDRWLLEPEQIGAIEAIRALDAHHLDRVRDVHASFESSVHPWDRPVVARHRAELSDIVSRTSALAVAGGHVAVLLNRMRLFGVLELGGNKPILAWSAGAMVLAERIVLFHDSPPQGPGNAEVLGDGLALLPDVVPLPHGSRRLRLGDPARVALFARRFAPSRCVVLDKGARLDYGDGLLTTEGCAVLGLQGQVEGRVAE